MYEEIEMKLRATSSFGARVNLKNSAGAEKKKKKAHTNCTHSQMMTEDANSLTTSKWLQWHSSTDVDVLMPQSPPPRSLQKSRISENAARVSVSLGDGSSISMNEGAALHSALFRNMLTATAFKEARERHVDLSAHDVDTARLVIEFLETEFESNGAFPLARPRVAFQFPIAPEQVFDVLHAAAYFEIAELIKLCITMYRDFVRDELVDAEAVALLPATDSGANRGRLRRERTAIVCIVPRRRRHRDDGDIAHSTIAR
jgi:hypothetical protein